MIVNFSKVHIFGLLSIAVAFGLFTSDNSIGQESPSESLPALRLHYRTPTQQFLHVVGQGDNEVGEVQKACKNEGLSLQKIDGLQSLPLDCSDFHTIMLGTNGVDFFGSEASEDRKEEVMKTLERFVARGGHFICFGSYNARNTERLKVFGLHTDFYHNAYFRPVPGRSEVFYSGFGNMVPGHGRLRSFGNFNIDESRKPVMLIQRGVVLDPANADVEYHPDASLLSTFSYKRGRVTYTSSEPTVEGLWLIPMFVKWVSRGSPTNKEQIGENVVVPYSLLREKNAPEFSPNAEELAAATQKFKQELEVDLSTLRLPALKKSYVETLEKEAAAEGTTPAYKYVLLREAALQHLELGQVTQFSDVVSDLDSEFLNVHVFFEESIPKLAAKVNDTAAKRELVDMLLHWTSIAKSDHRYQSAKQLLVVAYDLAKSLDDTVFTKKIGEAQQEIDAILQAEEPVRAELDSLGRGQLDAAGKTKVGIFYGFQCGDWDRAFPLLVEGQDEQLKSIAQLEQRASKMVRERLELGRFWDKQSQDHTGLAKYNLAIRARHWYLNVLPDLKSSEYKEVADAVARLELPKAVLNVQLKLDGAGRITIRPKEYRWEGHFGELIGSIRLNSNEWDTTANPVLQRNDSDGMLPLSSQLNRPTLRRIKGRGQVTLNRTNQNEIVVDLHDVPVGADDYEFEVELIR